MPFWERAVIAAVVILAAAVLAKVVDAAMRRMQLAPGAETRYRVLRRAVMAFIVIVAILSSLLVFPQVRTVAGALLASGAVIALVVGFAAQRTLGNCVAGILIAFTQPLRLGEEDPYVRQLGHFVDCLRDDVPFVVQDAEVLAGLEVAEHCYGLARAA